MRYCRRCLVYIEEDIAACPLCKKQLVNMGQELAKEQLFSTGRLPKAEDQESFWVEHKKTDSKIIKRRIFGFYTILNIAAILVLVGINISQYSLLKDKFFSYSPVISLFFSYLLITCFWHIKNKVLAGWLMGLLISLFLIALDARDQELTWSLSKGIPITWAAILPLVLPATAWSLSRIKGYNVMAWFALATGFSLMLIDLATSNPAVKVINGWSIITLGVFISIFIFFFYMHYMLKMHIYLDRVFHVKRHNEGDA